MRGERRGFLLDRGLLGHGRCGGRGLVPLDRLRLARHRAGEHLVHARDRNDLEPFLDALADVCTENSVLIDYVTESPNVSGDDRSVMLVPDRIRLAVQVEAPT